MLRMARQGYERYGDTAYVGIALGGRRILYVADSLVQVHLAPQIAILPIKHRHVAPLPTNEKVPASMGKSNQLQDKWTC